MICSVRKGLGGLAGGLLRASGGTGRPLAVRPWQRNPRTAVFDSDDGPNRARESLSGVRISEFGFVGLSSASGFDWKVI